MKDFYDAIKLLFWANSEWLEMLKMIGNIYFKFNMAIASKYFAECCILIIS